MIDGLIPLKLQLFAIGFSVLLLVFIIALIRKNQMKEGYAILWFLIGIAFLVISVWTHLLAAISFIIGVDYEPALLFAVLLFGVIMLSIHFSILFSGYEKKNKILAQNMGLLQWEIEQLKQQLQAQKNDTNDKINTENVNLNQK